MTTYEDSGVNIELGDDVSKMLYNAAKETWKNREGKLGELIVPFDDFTGVRAIDVSSLPPGSLMNIGFDGVGTKMEVAERIGDHSTIAHDLFAMVCDDAVVRGAEPVMVGSILDVRSLAANDKSPFNNQVKQLAHGYIAAANAANVAVVNGEVAELGDRVGGFASKGFMYKMALEYIGINLDKDNWDSMRMLANYLTESNAKKREDLANKMNLPEFNFAHNLEKSLTFNYNWGAAVVWFAKRNGMFTGHEIMENDYIVGLKEKGPRSNGLSLLRKVATDVEGPNWHLKTFNNGESIAKAMLEPSKIYSKAVVEMMGGYSGSNVANVHGFAHITGGGLPGKLGRVLKVSGLGAMISDPLEPCNLMLYAQEKGKVSDEEAHNTWNMGQGGAVITSKPDKVIEIATQHGIESDVIGRVTSQPGIRIISKGYYSKNRTLNF
jgi:phosphoribosylformylglycinamidine cyclo-ligase